MNMSSPEKDKEKIVDGDSDSEDSLSAEEDIDERLELQSSQPDAIDGLSEEEVIKKYKRMLLIANFFSMWYGYESLMKRENRKYLRIRAAYARDPSFLLAKTSEEKALKEEMDTIKLLRFGISKEARNGMKQAHVDAGRFFQSHYRILVKHKLALPAPATTESDEMTGRELEEVITILRSQWREMIAKLSKASSKK